MSKHTKDLRTQLEKFQQGDFQEDKWQKLTVEFWAKGKEVRHYKEYLDGVLVTQLPIAEGEAKPNK